MISNFLISTPFVPSKPLPHLDKASGSICSCILCGESPLTDSAFSNLAISSSLKTYDRRGSTKDRCPVSVEIKAILDVRGLQMIRIPGGKGPKIAVPSMRKILRDKLEPTGILNAGSRLLAYLGRNERSTFRPSGIGRPLAGSVAG